MNMQISLPLKADFCKINENLHASAPVREVLKKLDRSQDVTAFKFYNKRAKETRVYGCQVSFNEIPASEVNNVETNSLVLSLVSEMVIYPAA